MGNMFLLNELAQHIRVVDMLIGWEHKTTTLTEGPEYAGARRIKR
jgi:hypothetical protein